MSEHVTAFALLTSCRGRDSEPVTTSELQEGETATLEVTRLSEQGLADAREVAELGFTEGEER
jgi:hypothetical protein